jgi:hypothetical protein
MITILQIVYFTSYLLPILFIALFFIKTTRLDFLKKFGILTLFIPILTYFYLGSIGYTLPLVLGYWILILFGASIFNTKGYTYPQSLSISFCLAYFGSFLWELPTLIYTIIMRGGVDGAFPLHIIYIFPILFIYEKIKTNQSKKEITITLTQILFYSVMVLFVSILSGFDIWNIKQNSISNQGNLEFLWMINRMVIIVGIFSIYIKSTLRKEQIQ